jgi:hypothetical protein
MARGFTAPDGRNETMPPGAGAPSDDGVSVDFLISMLAALARMAIRSSRRQADLQTAMRGERLMASPVRILACAHHLERMGYVRNLLELEDGGVLLTVTAEGFDRLRLTSHRGVVENGRR